MLSQPHVPLITTKFEMHERQAVGSVHAVHRVGQVTQELPFRYAPALHVAQLTVVPAIEQTEHKGTKAVHTAQVFDVVLRNI